MVHVTRSRCRSSMRRLALALFVVSSVPGAAWAQSGIAGVVRDPSGAVLPGVTVEASSPALIEKARTVVTDGGGVYLLNDLRPGEYRVTFTFESIPAVRSPQGYVALTP